MESWNPRSTHIHTQNCKNNECSVGWFVFWSGWHTNGNDPLCLFVVHSTMYRNILVWNRMEKFVRFIRSDHQHSTDIDSQWDCVCVCVGVGERTSDECRITMSILYSIRQTFTQSHLLMFCHWFRWFSIAYSTSSTTELSNGELFMSVLNIWSAGKTRRKLIMAEYRIRHKWFSRIEASANTFHTLSVHFRWAVSNGVSATMYYMNGWSCWKSWKEKLLSIPLNDDTQFTDNTCMFCVSHRCCRCGECDARYDCHRLRWIHGKMIRPLHALQVQSHFKCLREVE